MRFLFLSSIIVTFAIITVPLDAHAASVFLSMRTGFVDAINSIALVDSSTQVKHAEGVLPAAIYRLDFSISAYDADLTIPLAVTRGASDQEGLEFIIESREGETTESGFAVGVLIPHEKDSSDDSSRTIQAGDTETFSLIAVFADTPDSSREDRLRISGMTLQALSKTARLNPSELSKLQTGFVELVETK